MEAMDDRYGITTREAMDSTPCDKCGKVHPPDEKDVELFPQCHPESGMSVQYREGCVVLKCSECDQFVVAFRIL